MFNSGCKGSKLHSAPIRCVNTFVFKCGSICHSDLWIHRKAQILMKIEGHSKDTLLVPRTVIVHCPRWCRCSPQRSSPGSSDDLLHRRWYLASLWSRSHRRPPYLLQCATQLLGHQFPLLQHVAPNSARLGVVDSKTWFRNSWDPYRISLQAIKFAYTVNHSTYWS